MSQFSDILMEHFSTPRNSGPMDTSDRVGIAGTPGSGPYVRSTSDLPATWSMKLDSRRTGVVSPSLAVPCLRK